MGLAIALVGPIMSILGFLLKLHGAKKETLDAFQHLVDQTSDDGLISMKTRTKFEEQKAAILARRAQAETVIEQKEST